MNTKLQKEIDNNKTWTSTLKEYIKEEIVIHQDTLINKKKNELQKDKRRTRHECSNYSMIRTTDWHLRLVQTYGIEKVYTEMERLVDNKINFSLRRLEEKKLNIPTVSKRNKRRNRNK